MSTSCNNATIAPTAKESSKTKRNENQNSENAEAERNERRSGKLASHERADAFGAFDFQARLGNDSITCLSTLSLVFNGVRMVM